MAPTATRSDVTAADGTRISTEAATWKGTAYSLIGAASAKGIGGDCSGSTWKIYTAVGLAFDYQMTGAFPDYVKKTGRFRELTATEKKQDGDLLLWPNHMAVYSSFTSAAEKSAATTPRTNAQGHKWTQTNDMWSATHPKGPGYEPAALKYWRTDAPRVFRYVK